MLSEQTPLTSLPMARWQIWARRIGLVGLIILVTYQLAHLLWGVIAPEPLFLKAPTQPAKMQSTNASSSFSIASSHLFGEISAEPAPVAQQVKAPETRLRLELHGVNRAPKKNQSSAIIARKGSRGEFYRVGDTIQGRTKLSDVYGNRVILDTAGRLEALYFEDADKSGSGVKTAAPKRTQTPARPKPAIRDQVADTSIQERIMAVGSVEEFVGVLNTEAEQDPQGLLKSLGLEAQGSGNGYRVSNNSLLLNVGMRIGDRLISVNGQALGDVASDQLLLAEVVDSGQASIVVERGGKRLTLNQNFGRKE